MKYILYVLLFTILLILLGCEPPIVSGYVLDKQRNPETENLMPIIINDITIFMPVTNPKTFKLLIRSFDNRKGWVYVTQKEYESAKIGYVWGKSTEENYITPQEWGAL